MAQPLLIVDVQRGFLNELTRHVPVRIATLVERGEHDPLIFTRFVNTPDSPYRRFLDWHECAAEPDTLLAPEMEALAKRGRVFVKQGLAGVPPEMAVYLQTLRPPEVHVVGIDTDMCVLKVAMDVFDLGIRPVILTDCCASTVGLQAHLAGLAILSRNVGPHQLLDKGLGDGVIAAPLDSSGRA